MFIGGRAIAGIGGSGLINGGLTMITGAVSPVQRARKMHPNINRQHATNFHYLKFTQA